MKRSSTFYSMTFLLLLIGSLFPLLSSNAQSDKSSVEKKVNHAIEAGNASELADFFTQKVDLSIPGTDDVFSKAQAEQILKAFFKEHSPNKLKLEHRGRSKLKDRYRIGKLITSNGDFRLTYFMKKVEDAFRIKKLRIEPYEGDL